MRWAFQLYDLDGDGFITREVGLNKCIKSFIYLVYTFFKNIQTCMIKSLPPVLIMFMHMHCTQLKYF